MGTAGIFSAGCGDDDPGTTVKPPKADAGKDTGPGGDPDATPAGDAAPDAPVNDTPPKLSLVHASGNLPTIAFCMGVGKDTAVNFTLDDVFPVPAGTGLSTGLPPGAGGPLKVDPARAKLIPGVDITPYAVPVALLAGAGNNDAGVPNGRSCKALIPNPNAPPAGVVRLTTIPAKTLKTGSSYVAAVIGCTGDASGSTARCGSDWVTGAGNVKLAILEVNKANDPGTTKSGFQFLHVSPQLESQQFGPTPDGGTIQIFGAGVVPAFYKPAPPPPDAGPPADAATDAATDDGGDAAADGATDAAAEAAAPVDAGSATIIPLSATPIKYVGFPATQASPLAPAPTNVTGVAGDPTWSIGLYPASGAVGAPPIRVPITSVLAATFGVGDAGINPPGLGFLENAKNYTLVLVGTPQESPPGAPTPPPNGAYFLRVIVLANDPNTTP